MVRLCGLLIVGMLFGFHAQESAATRYLAFQMFTGAPDTRVPIGGSGMNPLSPPPDKEEMSRFVAGLVDAVGTTGDAQHRLAFIIGPLAFDHTDAQLQAMIADAFAIALEHDIAVGFHIDDSMFWARRSDLWSDPANVEWLDWAGTPNTGRRIDWGPEPTQFPPQMCFNSPTIQAEVRRLARDVIGAAVRAGIDTLAEQGRPDLFAGVIAGWETQIGRDYETGQYLGYCALTQRGFSATNPPPDLDAEREAVVGEFIGLWTGALAEAGVERIYSHTAFTSRQTYDSLTTTATYSEVNQFAPPPVAFGATHNPGFSTYPQPGLLEQLYDALEERGSPPWASSEGANLNPATLSSGSSTETYLAGLFNRGAVLVNLFGWGVGPDAVPNPFRAAAEAPEALDAYRKFLRGETLVEGEVVFLDLPAKIARIQAELPPWVGQNPARQAEVEALLLQLDQYITENRYDDASAVADALLALINSAS